MVHITFTLSTRMVDQMNPTQQRQNFRANSSKQSDADTLREARDLVDQYLRYLKLADLGLDVVDIDDLPFRKQLLVSAVRLLIATESSATTRQQLRKVGLTLASFQDDIGQRMTMRPLPAEERMSEQELQAAMKKHRHLIARFDRAFAAMATERVRLDDLFQQSMRMAERRESNAAAASRRPAYEAGGTYSPYL
ncbi:MULTISPECIES: hypothetical protein [Rhizobium]|uniref:MarR family transcriptional regulator n=2 Tax=Rhizobium TaxID=379 RepID=A0ABY8IEZ8_9HYPH|nr:MULTISPECIES: hypothetical protein [Rhizobium]MBZ5762702.1 hypothetical protein [Rhizobium sp. VS19-DR96]MBZ5768614.1 hypothetical protein [Rhizobium sp. VS19-DR129.2]MBZ5776128.1 hypothetical protein [Rhizobium sp. VS19-DRK62.2]MBZ5787432.1 hypothetical protein [Rhizobium sp. VS19-DR121]MBZ5804720.1 hypothetical protein [Rhizobium sp. VS19-DR181]